MCSVILNTFTASSMEINPVNMEYFSSYEDLEIHRLMLEDSARTEAYKNAILINKEYFNNKVVMDIGCGTGILSVFCAQAGAKKVYAVEASGIANIAREIVKENKFEDVIEVIHSKIEDLVLPVKVDAIVSEWMGFYLLHEGMLDSIVVARDRFLKDDGVMFPESAAIYIAPCSVPSLYKQWDELYGVSMSTFAKHLRASKYSKPEIMSINPDDLIGNEVELCWLDLRDLEVQDVNAFTIQHVAASTKSGVYQGLCLWFECTFPDLVKDGTENVKLSTSPHSLATHWKQTTIVLPQDQVVEEGEGEPIAFQLDMTRDANNCRRYNLQVTLLDPEAIEHSLPCDCHMTKCILTKAFMLEHPERQIGDGKPSMNCLVEEPIDDDE